MSHLFWAAFFWDICKRLNPYNISRCQPQWLITVQCQCHHRSCHGRMKHRQKPTRAQSERSYRFCVCLGIRWFTWQILHCYSLPCRHSKYNFVLYFNYFLNSLLFFYPLVYTLIRFIKELKLNIHGCRIWHLNSLKVTSVNFISVKYLTNTCCQQKGRKVF